MFKDSVFDYLEIMNDEYIRILKIKIYFTFHTMELGIRILNLKGQMIIPYRHFQSWESEK